MARAPLVIAHRGDSAHRPENTLASFASALEVGVTLVELDVQLTADGACVVIHDPTLDRTTTGRGEVRKLTLSEVRAVSAGYPEKFGDAFAGERVPTLAEALSFLRDRARVMIEIKREAVTDDAEGGVEASTLAEVRRLGMAERVAISSFDHRALLRLRDQAPEVTRGHLFGRTTPDEVLQAAAETGCAVVLPHKSQLSDALVERVREAGLRLGTWLVDEPEELRQLARFGLFAVGTNRPGLIIDAIAEGLLE